MVSTRCRGAPAHTEISNTALHFAPSHHPASLRRLHVQEEWQRKVSDEKRSSPLSFFNWKGTKSMFKVPFSSAASAPSAAQRPVGAEPLLSGQSPACRPSAPTSHPSRAPKFLTRAEASKKKPIQFCDSFQIICFQPTVYVLVPLATKRISKKNQPLPALDIWQSHMTLVTCSKVYQTYS